MGRPTQVRAVEKAASDDRDNMFQIVHDDATLYLCAGSAAEVADWLTYLRNACVMPHNLSRKNPQ